MKIQSTVHTAPIDRAQADSGRRGARKADARPVDTVSFSGEANFVRSLRDEARQPEGLRTELVNETRAAIDGGTLDNDVDMDRVLDALLADL